MESLPPDWIAFLEPKSYARLQCTTRSSVPSKSGLEAYWTQLCVGKLRPFLQTPEPTVCSFEILLQLDSDNDSQIDDCSDARCDLDDPRSLGQSYWRQLLRRQQEWWRAVQDLAGSEPVGTGHQAFQEIEVEASAGTAENLNIDSRAGSSIRSSREDTGSRSVEVTQAEDSEDEVDQANHLEAVLHEMEYKGTIWSTLGNELRHKPEDFQQPPAAATVFPQLAEAAVLLAPLNFAYVDQWGRHTSCRLMAQLGGDRCVLAHRPLPQLGSITALPMEPAPVLPATLQGVQGSARTGNAVDDGCGAASPGSSAQKGFISWRWQLARRNCSYYEVTLSRGCGETALEVATRQPSRRPQCVSVGLAMAALDMRSLRQQQAGWNLWSWALHGDDGQLYHGHGRGSTFRPIMVLPEQGDMVGAFGYRERGDSQSESRPRRRMPTFAAGDVVGCGVIELEKHSEQYGIFFTLNGEFLGICFLFEAAREPRLWPCVGVDAHWPLMFNFGSEPFRFDMKALHAGELVMNLNHTVGVEDITHLLDMPGSCWDREVQIQAWQHGETNVSSDDSTSEESLTDGPSPTLSRLD